MRVAAVTIIVRGVCGSTERESEREREVPAPLANPG